MSRLPILTIYAPFSQLCLQPRAEIISRQQDSTIDRRSNHWPALPNPAALSLTVYEMATTRRQFLLILYIFITIMSSEAAKYIQSRLLGAWELQNFYYHPIDDPSNKSYPQGPEARGTIMYTPDGYMSAQVVRPGQAHFDDGGGLTPLLVGTPADWETVGRNFIAYSGRFFLDDSGAEPVLWHEMSVCMIPRMVGSVSKRVVRIKEVDGALTMNLGIDEALIGGVKSVVKVEWKKSADNDFNKLPPAGLSKV
jgi:hypothetical protein